MRKLLVLLTLLATTPAMAQIPTSLDGCSFGVIDAISKDGKTITHLTAIYKVTFTVNWEKTSFSFAKNLDNWNVNDFVFLCNHGTTIINIRSGIHPATRLSDTDRLVYGNVTYIQDLSLRPQPPKPVE